MKTAIKFNALRTLPSDQQETALKQAIDLELRKTSIMLSFLEANKHLQMQRYAANDGNGKMPSVTEKQVEGFLAQNLHMLMDSDAQKALAAGEGLHAAGKALFGAKYAVGTDNPYLTDLASRFATFFHSNMPELDTGWMQLYDLVDLRNAAQDHFDVDSTNAGITFTQQKPGAEIKKRTKITESKTTCSVITYGAALGLLDDWLTFQQYWKVDDVIGEFRANHFDKMAEVHYAPITALTGIDENFATDDPTTFNNAAATMIRALRTAGYGVGQNVRFKIICSPEKVGRILRMLSATQSSNIVDFGTVAQPIAYTVDAVISTTYVASNDTGYYLVIPGRKMKRGLWKDLSLEQLRNPAVRATDWYASAQYNPIVGDSAQVRRVKYS